MSAADDASAVPAEAAAVDAAAAETAAAEGSTSESTTTTTTATTATAAATTTGAGADERDGDEEEKKEGDEDEDDDLDEEISVEHDLANRMLPFLDPHMAIPMLEFLQKYKVYNARDLRAAKIQVIMNTKMVDLAVEEYKLQGEAPPTSMDDLRRNVLATYKARKSDCGDLLGLLAKEDGAFVASLVAEKLFTLDHLYKNYHVSAENVQALFRYAKLNFEIGRYGDAATFLGHYIHLAPTSPDATEEHKAQALWGKLGAEIMMNNSDASQLGLKQLAEKLSTRVGSSQLELLDNRTWLAHWSLFVYSVLEDGRALFLEFVFDEELRMLPAIQMNCPHLLRYVAASAVLSRRRRGMMQEVVRVLLSEADSYADPVTRFLTALYMDFDFAAAHRELGRCRAVLAGDFFLRAHRAAFMDEARLLFFELYCRLHARVDIATLSHHIGITEEKAREERWLVDLIKSAHVDAKVDSSTNAVVIGVRRRPLYQNIIDSAKELSRRTNVVVSGVDRKVGGPVAVE